MTISMEHQIETWVEANLHLVSLRKPAYDHVDYIVGRELAQAEAIRTSLDAFAALVEQMRKRQVPVHAVLGIPLGSESNILEIAVPQNLQAVEDQWRKEEPPSLYLVSWDARKLLHIVELYRCPLPFDLYIPPIAGAYAYYEEGRSLEDIKHDDEFVKSVNVEYYPEPYR